VGEVPMCRRWIKDKRPEGLRRSCRVISGFADTASSADDQRVGMAVAKGAGDIGFGSKIGKR